MIKSNILALIKNFIRGLDKEARLGRHPKVKVAFNRTLKMYSLRLESERMSSQTLDLSLEEYKFFKGEAKSVGIPIV